jgi:AraC-like DNA-binding protein
MKTKQNFQTTLDELRTLALENAPEEGQNFTVIPSISIYRRNAGNPLALSVLTPAICLVLSGAKRINIGAEVIDYCAGEYLASIIDLPVSGQVLEASEEIPYIGVRVDFTNEKIADVALRSKLNVEPQTRTLSPGAFVGKADLDLLHILSRMLNLNNNPKEQSFLYGLYMQELIYNLLSSRYGYFFIQQVQLFQQATGIGHVILWINKNFAQPFSIEELAKENNMSPSSLHHKFKAITTMGPLQYQKQLRLLEARRLMLNNSMDVVEAALEVGYESPSQFNREYKRLFGQPPLRDIKSVHNKLQVNVTP